MADARDQAATEARAAATAEAAGVWGTKILDAVAAAYIADEAQRASFLAITSPERFIVDGDFDVDKLITTIGGMFPPETKKPRTWGPPQDRAPQSGAELGHAEAQKRFGTKNTNQ